MTKRDFSFDLAGRVVVVTGAAQGIGAATAQLFAESGAKTVVHYNSNQHGAEGVVETIERRGGNAHVVQGDLRNEDEVRRLIEGTVQRFRGLDVLVNNVGIYPNDTIGAMTLDSWRDVYQTNVESAFLCIKHAISHLEGSSAASVINIASINAFRPGYEHAHYNSSKAALVSLTKSAAQELGPKGIRVNSVSPGLVWREGIETAWSDGVERWQARAPLTRLGLPEDVAGACLFLSSSAASWITGHDLIVDGGVSSASAF